MITYENLDPEQVKLAKQFKDFVVDSDSLAPLRAMVGQMSQLSDDLPTKVTRRPVTYAARDGYELTGWFYQNTAQTAPSPLIFAIHGGGLVMGSPKDNDARHLLLCAELGCSVFSADYRLAPEDPFPTPLNDCWDGLEYIFKNAKRLEVDKSRIALSGDSAGGCLAAGLSQSLRDQTPVIVKCLCLVYPMLDASTGIETEVPAHLGQHVWTRASNKFGWESYLNGLPKTAPASPAHLKDFEELPPTYMFTGELDLFFPEIITFAEGLLHAEVDAKVYAYPKSIHGFNMSEASDHTQQFNVDYKQAIIDGLGL